MAKYKANSLFYFGSTHEEGHCFSKIVTIAIPSKTCVTTKESLSPLAF